MKKRIKAAVRHPEICVIGTGMGGGSFLTRLVENGWSATVVEAGDFSGSSKEMPSKCSGRPFKLKSTRYIGVGGTTNLWHGLMAPLDERDFKSGNPLGWPFDFQKLIPYYQQATSFLTGDAYKLSETDCKEAEAHFDLFTNGWLERPYFQRRPVLRLGDKIRKLALKGDIDLKVNSRVTGITRSTDGKFSVEIVSPGATSKIKEFDVVVIASGALETPAILLRSSLGGDNVGRYLSDHPMAPIVSLKLDSKQRRPKYTGSIIRGIYKYFSIRPGPEITTQNINLMVRPTLIADAVFSTEKIKNDLICIRDGKATLKTFLAVLFHPLVVLDILRFKFGAATKFNHCDMHAVVEQTPYYDSRVTLSAEIDEEGVRIPDFHWQISPSDISNVRKVYEEIFKLYGDKVGQVLHHFDWEDRLTSAAHHSGTARAGNDSSNSVVDEDLCVHNVPGLYVCDASVIPQNGSANLGLTICALAFRLADHIHTSFVLDDDIV